MDDIFFFCTACGGGLHARCENAGDLQFLRTPSNAGKNAVMASAMKQKR